MTSSRQLLAPMVSAAVALIIVTNYCIIKVLGHPGASAAETIGLIWPIALPTSVAVTLVMSTLYHNFQEVLSELAERQEELRLASQRDALTGVASRSLLEERLHRTVRQFLRSKQSFALIMLDLDHFKRVNDLHGHQVGDALLREAARRLQFQIRETDTLARFGGDEFLILQTDVTKPTDVRDLCTRIRKNLETPYLIDDIELRLPVSIGAAISSTRLTESSDYIRAADMALYEAKACGRNCYRFFSEALDARLRRRDALETDLRAALRTGAGIAVRFQPQLCASGKITGAESLFRWSHAKFGDIPATEAVAIAEDSDLVDHLGELVLRRASQFARAHPTLTVAVNLSPAQFSRSSKLPETLGRIVRDEGIEPSQIELEITEKLFMRVGADCEKQIARLREIGFRVALDDFGTGYSSLSYLRRFKVDRLKLDKSFASSDSPEEDIAVIRAAVAMAHLLGLEVVAEGIETEMQEAIALEGGCDSLQGHRYAPALTEAEFDVYLRQKLRAAA